MQCENCAIKTNKLFEVTRKDNGEIKEVCRLCKDQLIEGGYVY